MSEVIAVDFDDTVVNTNDVKVVMAERMFEKKIDGRWLESATIKAAIARGETPPISLDQYKKLQQAVYSDPTTLEIMEPTPDAIRYLEKIACRSGRPIHIVTSRSEPMAIKMVEQFMDRYQLRAFVHATEYDAKRTTNPKLQKLQ